MTQIIDQVTDWILWLGAKIMPVKYKTWTKAMQAETLHIRPAAARLLFALGSLKAAVMCRAKSREVLGRLGQALIGGGLLALCLALAAVYPDMQDAAMRSVFLKLGVVYALCAGLAFTQLKWLNRLSAYGFLTCSAAYLAVRIFGLSYAALPSAFLSAIIFELAGIMAGIFIASFYVLLIGSIDDDASPSQA